MKNKIFLSLFFCFVVFFSFNFVNAAEDKLSKDEIFKIACQELQSAGHNYCFGKNINIDGIYVVYGYDYEPYIKDNILYRKQHDDGKCYFYYVYYNEYGNNVHNRIFDGFGGVVDAGNGYSYELDTFDTHSYVFSNFDLKNETGEIIMENGLDDTIGDPNSDLQLSYQYNEDYTSCHIDATIKGGAFTDKIYYSNYQPGITGELLTKRGFPKERYRYY